MKKANNKKSGSSRKNNAPAQVENQHVMTEQETPVTETPKDAATENPAPVQDASPADKPEAWKPNVKTPKEVLFAALNKNYDEVKSRAASDAESKKVLDMIVHTKKNLNKATLRDLRELVDDVIALLGDDFQTPPLDKEEAKKLLKNAGNPAPSADSKPTEGKSDEKKPDAAKPNPAPVQQEGKKPDKEPELIAGIFPKSLDIEDTDADGNPVVYRCEPLFVKSVDELKAAYSENDAIYTAHYWTATHIRQYGKPSHKPAWKPGQKHEFPNDLDLAGLVFIHPEACVAWSCSLYDASLYEMNKDSINNPDNERGGIFYSGHIESLFYQAVADVTDVYAEKNKGKK